MKFTCEKLYTNVWTTKFNSVFTHDWRTSSADNAMMLCCYECALKVTIPEYLGANGTIEYLNKLHIKRELQIIKSRLTYLQWIGYSYLKVKYFFKRMCCKVR